jgi:aminopeptidase N
MNAQAVNGLQPLDINMKFYHIDIEVSLDKPFIQGKTTCEFVLLKPGTQEFYLDLDGGLEVTKVEGAANFTQQKDKNVVWLKMESPMQEKEKRHRVTVHYEGEPRTIKHQGTTKGLIYSQHGPNKSPVISTITYPDHARMWFPCRDGLGDKVDSVWLDITIEDRKAKSINPIDQKEVNLPFTVVANGRLAGVDTKEGRKTFRWRNNYRIAPHHIAFSISNYAKKEIPFKDDAQPYSINFYFFLENAEQNNAMFERATEVMSQLKETFGPYPFPKDGLSIVETGIPMGYDGMLGQANILLEDLKGFHIYRLVHLAANQWFGCHISPLVWQDIWIFDAMSSYAEAMWQEYKRGIPVRQIILDEKEYWEGGKLYNENPRDYDYDRLNRKGMYIIHMLRGVMGDDYFFQTIKGITGLKRRKDYYISTKDFQETAEYYASENTNQDYAYFFKQWVFGEFFPEYNLVYEVNKKNVLTLNLNQTNRSTEPRIFEMPFQLKLNFTDKTNKTVVLRNNASAQTYTLNLEKPLLDLEFDPENWILKQVQFIRQKTNTKTPIEEVSIKGSQGNRLLEVEFTATKKQDVVIELYQLADKNIPNSTTTQLSTIPFKGVEGKQKQSFKIPLDGKQNGNFLLKIVGKSDVYYKYLRVKIIEKMFD